ncbi:MAG: hypothetical protein ACE5E9_04330 [Nitrospinaceae bacterium]
MLEPFFRIMENQNPDVKKHFTQAVTSLKENKTAIALLNLNMVLSLKSNHFLARVYRGRLYIREGRYRLASEDYLQANKISPYRFNHYDLCREYLSSVKREFGELETSITKNFEQIFKVLRQSQEKHPLENEMEESMEALPYPDENDSSLDEVLELRTDQTPLDPEERSDKFKKLGPITQKEIERTDWDKLIKELTSS